MVEIPFTILMAFVIISFFMVVFGLFTRRMFGVYFMGTIIIVLTGVIWITMFAQIDTVSGIDSNFNQTTSSIPITVDHMNQQTGNSDTTMRNGFTEVSCERVATDTSVLVNKQINQVTFRIDRAGNNLDKDIYFGVWDSNTFPSISNARFIIGQFPANNTVGTHQMYTVTRNDTKIYSLKPNDCVGIFYNGGTVANNIAVSYNSTASTFDGTNSNRMIFNRNTASWSSGADDWRAKISLVTNNIQELNNSDKYDFNSVVKIYLVFFGVIIILTGGIYQLNGQRDKR